MLEFETPAGNMYAWDGEMGLFIPFSPTMKAIISDFSSQNSLSREKVVEQLKEDFDVEELTFCYDWMEKWRKIRPQNYKYQILQKYHASDIRSYLLRFGLLHLTLCVTEDCNFRCKYCVYSDFYKYDRGYSNKYMDFTIAKKAIDYYFSLLKEGERYNPLREPTIGFYGGEPLLNFKLIKKCVEYVEGNYNYNKIEYAVTTNGSLLDEEKANLLMKHDFSIAVSLDGPEEEHNRLRVYSNGKGSFRKVMENVGLMMDVGYEKIYSLPVFDWKSDLFKLEEFFNRKDVPAVQRVSMVENDVGCSYYEQFTKEDRLAFLDQLKMARNCYFENLDQQKKRRKISFFDDLIAGDPRRVLFDGISISPHNPIVPFTAACVPGRNIFVDVNGYYHICEKINNAFSIGNVDDGLNFGKISRLIGNYISCMDKCPDCEMERNCGHCYKSFTTDKEFLLSSKVCGGIEYTAKDSFVETFTIAETKPQLVEESNFKHKNVRKYYGE